MGTTGITGTMRGGTIITLDIPDGLLPGAVGTPSASGSSGAIP